MSWKSFDDEKIVTPEKVEVVDDISSQEGSVQEDNPDQTVGSVAEPVGRPDKTTAEPDKKKVVDWCDIKEKVVPLDKSKSKPRRAGFFKKIFKVGSFLAVAAAGLSIAAASFSTPKVKNILSSFRNVQKQITAKNVQKPIEAIDQFVKAYPGAVSVFLYNVTHPTDVAYKGDLEAAVDSMRGKLVATEKELGGKKAYDGVFLDVSPDKKVWVDFGLLSKPSESKSSARLFVMDLMRAAEVLGPVENKKAAVIKPVAPSSSKPVMYSVPQRKKNKQAHYKDPRLSKAPKLHV